MSDETGEGLLKKYEVSRLGDANNKHLGCRYFVLDPRHDSHAVTALQAYSDSVRDTHPHLSHDIDNWLTAVEIEKEQIAASLKPKPLTAEELTERDCVAEHHIRCCIRHDTHVEPHVFCALR